MSRIIGLTFPIPRLHGSFFRSSPAVLLVTVLWANPVRAAEILWRDDVVEAAGESRVKNKPMLVMVSAAWCGYCHKMLRQTFPNPKVAARINGQFVPVLIDADRDSALVQKLKVEAMPTVLIVGPDRKILGTISGFQTAAQLDAKLASFKVDEQNRTVVKESPPAPPTETAGRKTTSPIKRTVPRSGPKAAK